MRIIPGRREWTGENPEHRRIYEGTPENRLLVDLWSEGPVGQAIARGIATVIETVYRIAWRLRNGGQ